ncbi:MAG: hypothetical protein JXB32_02560 [Deltaproteobacteria bacterium]|nr:hypothetical protein [Deltaproteobacteria bacterium]
MRTWVWILVACAIGACGSSDDDDDVPDTTTDVPAETPVDVPVETPADTPPEAEIPAEVAPDVATDDGTPLGPCALAGGTCRGLVAGCASCPAGEAPSETTVRCPPDNYCCLPFTPPDPLPECLEHGGVCFPASSGSECPTGWMREPYDCGGPAGCCVPGDSCV